MAYPPLELALAFLKTGELTDALDALNQHLSASPTDDFARRLRIETCLRLQHYNEALVDSDTLMQPTADDWARRSVIHEQLSDLDGAIQAVQTALTMQPNDERFTERLIGLLQAKGNYAAALQALAHVPQTWRWRQWAGDLAAQAGQPDAAIACYTEALGLLAQHTDLMTTQWGHPLQARLLLTRAAVYRQRGAFDSADGDFAAAEALISDDPMIAFQRGLIAHVRGDTSGLERCQAVYQAASPRLQAEMQQALAQMGLTDTFKPA